MKSSRLVLNTIIERETNYSFVCRTYDRPAHDANHSTECKHNNKRVPPLSVARREHSDTSETMTMDVEQMYGEKTCYVIVTVREFRSGF